MPSTKTTSELPLLDHLRELRTRLMRIAAILLAGLLVSGIFAQEIFAWLQRPLLRVLPENIHFITLSPLEGWASYFRIGLVFGAIITAPLWLYQLWAFLAPGLIRRERSMLLSAVIASSLFFALGTIFCHSVVMPFGFHYLLGMLDDTGIALMPQMKLYLSFVLQFMLAFGLIFQVPLVVPVLVKWELVEVRTLTTYRRHMIVAAFVVAAILTPPDVVSQVCMALPLILLYEVGILSARLFVKEPLKKARLLRCPSSKGPHVPS